jgi:hypothetical protein
MVPLAVHRASSIVLGLYAHGWKPTLTDRNTWFLIEAIRKEKYIIKFFDRISELGIEVDVSLV